MKILLVTLLFLLFASPCFSQDRIKGFTRIKTDDFTNTYTFALWNSFSLTGMDIKVMTGGGIDLPRMFVEFYCVSTDWVYFDKITFKYNKNGETLFREIPFNVDSKKRVIGDYYGGVCCEYIQIFPDVELLDILTDVASSKDVILRYEGKGGSKNYSYGNYYLPSLKKAMEWYVATLMGTAK